MLVRVGAVGLGRIGDAADQKGSEQVAARLICRDRWLDQGIDLAAYNSFETAADVADLWQALGYEQVNLFGGSYGSLLAQAIMRELEMRRDAAEPDA